MKNKYYNKIINIRYRDENGTLPCLIEAPATFHGEFGKGPKKPCTDGSKPSDKIVCTAGHNHVKIFCPMENDEPQSP